MKQLLTVEQLSEFLHKSVASIRSDSTRNPQSLPPICRIPGNKRLLWRVEDVELWLAAYVSKHTQTQEVLPEQANFSARRGRPTKAEQLERKRRAQNMPAGYGSPQER